MFTLAFWNVNRSDRSALIADMCREWEVDVLVLAEADRLGGPILRRLNPTASESQYRAIACQSRLRLFARSLPEFIRPVGEATRYSVFELERPGSESFLLAVAHLASKREADPSAQRVECEQLAGAVRNAERKCRHSRTVVVGDLNVNPFEEGMLLVSGLHAVSSRLVAAAVTRRVRGVDHEFFYNPMWSFLGDASAGPPGSFFYQRARDVELFWHMFDQVLLRPSLLPYYPDDGARILTRIGTVGLCDSRGRPDPEVGSDHFPIVLRLNW